MTVEARIVTELASIGVDDWAALDGAGNPFLSRAFLGALEDSGSLAARNGWTPHHLALFDDGRLVAAAPSYIKTNSHGEFVFDWAWAEAYHRHGLPYYPKLLSGVPYSPIAGPRLLVRRGRPDADGLRRRLVDFALEVCARDGLSTWHCNFTTPQDDAVLAQAGLLPRSDWQFHWHNRAYADFDGFLETLRSRKRKGVRRERRQVADAGVRFRWLQGSELQADELDFVYSCYLITFHRYGNHPALNRDFFSRLAAAPGDPVRVALAMRADQPIAMSLFLAGGGRLYGRYWGCLEELPGLHFETAYYQGIEYCIDNGIAVFESGAQGEHKVSRGFEPVRTRSWHHVREPEFRRAIAAHLERERGWMDDYRARLTALSPYHRDGE